MRHLFLIVLVILTMAGWGFARGNASGDPEGKEPEMDSGPAMMMEAELGNALVEFTDLEAARALAEAGPVVRFFYADWCPFCRADLKELRDGTERLEGITVVVVDYDEEGDLKRKYGITYQHTYVQIDADGEKLALWNGGGVDGILDNTLRGEM